MPIGSQLPQFIEMEDRIVGPLTLKQVLYLGAGAGLLFILWFFLKLWAFLLATLVIMSICFALAFAKINGRSLPRFILNWLVYLFKPKSYLWKKNK